MNINKIVMFYQAISFKELVPSHPIQGLSRSDIGRNHVYRDTIDILLKTRNVVFQKSIGSNNGGTETNTEKK